MGCVVGALGLATERIPHRCRLWSKVQSYSLATLDRKNQYEKSCSWRGVIGVSLFFQQIESVNPPTPLKVGTANLLLKASD
ncbi:hypothetical protein MITS9509_03180 [Synechococcus sp. MIT S9509]|nr:hypothetical protein MITS9504_03086 [Synechococcus sp. MIT S9504]KZR88854.1 hypothetical protein MITS9509_03180 [Synechococcus sp. MIT S9509]